MVHRTFLKGMLLLLYNLFWECGYTKVLSYVVICPYLSFAFQTCQSRIILALKNYTRIFHKNGVFKNSACSRWSEQANKIADVTGDILRVLEVCVFLFKIFASVSCTSFWCYAHLPHFIEQEAKSYSHILICYPPGKFRM